MTKRNVGVAILLTILTCGIYGIYWEICLVNDINKVTGNENATSGGMVFLFSLLTCNIYWLYWLYKAGQMIDDTRVALGKASGNKAILNIVLSLFGLGIVAIAIMQSDVNELIDAQQT